MQTNNIYIEWAIYSKFWQLQAISFVVLFCRTIDRVFETVRKLKQTFLILIIIWHN